jgi:hypothetical protein
MHFLIKLAFVLLICLVGIGYFRGWFSFSSSPNPNSDGSKVNVNISVDKKKIGADIEKAEQKLKGKAKTIEDKASPKTTK